MDLTNPRLVAALLEPHREQLQEALDRAGNTHDLSDIVDAIVRGEMQIWIDANSVLITAIIDFPRKRVLHIHLAAGNLQELIAMHDYVGGWAASVGCEMLTLHGRPGWQRALSKSNWQLDSVALRWDLRTNNGRRDAQPNNDAEARVTSLG